MKNNKFKVLLIILVWICCTAQQCSGSLTDACGSYTTNPFVVKITPTINLLSKPSNVPFPVIQNFGNISNAINIQASIFSPDPKSTIFGIKSETYALCNGVPRFSNSCCMTKTFNGCYSSGQENIYQLSMIYQGAFKSKITVRAIVDNHMPNAFLTGSFLFEGSIDMDATTGTPPSEIICELKYIKKLPFNPGPNPIEFCNFNQ